MKYCSCCQFCGLRWENGKWSTVCAKKEKTIKATDKKCKEFVATKEML